MSRPTIAKRPPRRERVFTLNPADLAGIRNALAGVVSTRGTAGSAALEGVKIAGKTGTAQAPPYPDHAWFVGFAPAENPKVVVAVFLEFGEHGYAAARVASRIIEAYLKRPTEAPPITDDLSGQRTVAVADSGQAPAAAPAVGAGGAPGGAPTPAPRGTR
jgi:penicillin-binding protein 2